MTTPQSIHVEINKLAPSAVIELFELDGTSVGLTDLLRFHAGTNELSRILSGRVRNTFAFLWR
jgi:phage-related protein